MTSVSPHQQTPSQASNTTSASQSYASATKKAVLSPPIATSSSSPSPAVAVGGSQPVQRNTKSSAISPVNGRAAITPAVPAVNNTPTHSTHTMNGVSIDHSRKASVTIGANGGYISNGGPVGGQKAGSIQFGSMTDTPPVSHSIPQITQSASVPIPIAGNNQRATSPAQSPSPIPQAPASSGGRPPSGLSQQGNGVTFGSLGGDGEVCFLFKLQHVELLT
jgi:translation initiation factor 4G